MAILDWKLEKEKGVFVFLPLLESMVIFSADGDLDKALQSDGIYKGKNIGTFQSPSDAMRAVENEARKDGWDESQRPA
jgi:hypothetical protein